MNDLDLTDVERRQLEDLRRLPTMIRSRVVGWSLELAVSVGPFAYGLLTGRRLFLVIGFLNLLYFALWRMYGQLRGRRLIQSIYEKRLSDRDQRLDG